MHMKARSSSDLWHKIGCILPKGERENNFGVEKGKVCDLVVAPALGISGIASAVLLVMHSANGTSLAGGGLLNGLVRTW